jgi:hypothetical protein
MSTPRAVGLVLMVVGLSAYGTAADWLALSVGLLGLAACQSARHGDPGSACNRSPLRVRWEGAGVVDAEP